MTGVIQLYHAVSVGRFTFSISRKFSALSLQFCFEILLFSPLRRLINNIIEPYHSALTLLCLSSLFYLSYSMILSYLFCCLPYSFPAVSILCLTFPLCYLFCSSLLKTCLFKSAYFVILSYSFLMVSSILSTNLKYFIDCSIKFCGAE